MGGAPAVGPAGYQPGEQRETSAVGLFIPWQLRQVPFRDANVSPDVESTVPQNEPSGRMAFTMTPSREQTYYLLDIRPLATVFRTQAEPLPTISEIADGQAWTPAKARVSWREAGGGYQHVDVDIGTGTTFTTPPSAEVQVDLLVPQRQGAEDVLIPDNLTFADLPNFGTTVICKGTCVYSPSASRARTTQCQFVAGVGGAPPPTIFPLPRGTRAVSIFAADTPGAVPLIAGDIAASFAVLGLPAAVAAAFPEQAIDFQSIHETGLVTVPEAYSAVIVRPTRDVVRSTVCVQAVLDL